MLEWCSAKHGFRDEIVFVVEINLFTSVFITNTLLILFQLYALTDITHS